MTGAGTEVDVLVVEAGVAGLSTALGLAANRSVPVLSAGDGSTPWAQGGITSAPRAADATGARTSRTAAPLGRGP
jgi:aspartate oxidase